MSDQRKSRRGKWILIAVIAAAAVGWGAWHFFGNHAVVAAYQTEPVTRGDLVQVVTATGQLNPVVNVQVGSQISGNILKLYADFNSTVKSNDIVAQLDPSTYKANVEKAEGDLASARAAQELAQVEANRSTALFTNKLISQSDFDTAVANLHEAQANVQLKQATLDSAKVDLSRCTILAPVDGVVISRNVDVGQTVAASFNTPTLFVIANDLTKMQIDALVSEADIGGVAVHQNVNFTVDAYPYRTFHGEVTQIRYGPVTNQNVVNYDAVIQVHNSDLKLLPGMTANVSIIVAEQNNVLKIPNAALRFHPPEEALAELKTNTPSAAMGARPGGSAGAGRRSGGTGGSRAELHSDQPGVRSVYILDATKDPQRPELKQVKVTTGINDGVDTELVGGLKEGDQVVTGVLIPSEDSRTVNPFQR